MAPEPSDWAKARFGDQAADVIAAIVAGLRAGHERALSAHAGSGLRTADAYGVVWLTVPEEVLARLLLIEGATVIHPARARYKLGNVNGTVIYPARLAKDLRTPLTEAKLKTSGVRQALFDGLGPAPAAVVPELTLFGPDDAVDVQEAPPLSAAEDLDDGAHLVLVAFVSSPDGGLAAAIWGEASMHEDGRLEWHHHERLDLTAPAAAAAPTLRIVRDEPEARPSFGNTPLEETELQLRTPLTETPPSEPQPPQDPTGNGDNQ